MSFLAVIVALALGAAGCGSTDGGAGDTSSATDAASTTTNLKVTLDVDGPGGKPPMSAPLVCVTGDPQDDGRQSTFSDCAAVEKLADDFAAPTPPDTACTEIFGGPEVVTLRGTFHGDDLDTKLTRANGCEIARFDPFVPILQKLFPGYQSGGAIGA